MRNEKTSLTTRSSPQTAIDAAIEQVFPGFYSLVRVLAPVVGCRDLSRADSPASAPLPSDADGGGGPRPATPSATEGAAAMAERPAYRRFSVVTPPSAVAAGGDDGGDDGGGGGGEAVFEAASAEQRAAWVEALDSVVLRSLGRSC